MEDQQIKPGTATTRSLESFLAVLGAVVCLIISIRIGQAVSEQQSVWPLPGLYLVEMVALSAGAVFCVIRNVALGGTVTWVVAGVCFAFVVMGAWSIGLWYLPVALIFVLTAIVRDRRYGPSMLKHLGVSVIAGLAQVALMLIAIRWLS